MRRRGSRPPSQRQLRVGEEMRHALAAVLGRGDLADPRLSGISITVTEVRVSPDLTNATAFVTPLGGESLDDRVAALNRAAGYIRARLAQEIVLKSVPRLSFKADQSFDAAQRMQSLLDSPKVRRDLEAERIEARDDRESDDESFHGL